MFVFGHVNPKIEHFFKVTEKYAISNPVEINFLLSLA